MLQNPRRVGNMRFSFNFVKDLYRSFFLYIKGFLFWMICGQETIFHWYLTLGKPYGIKLRCYWERLREQLGNLGTLKGTCWEHVGNKGKRKKKKKNSLHPTLKMSACWAFPLTAWNFYFWNSWSPFLAKANGRGEDILSMKEGSLFCFVL